MVRPAHSDRRQNFPARIRRLLAERAGFRCSAPDCCAPTSGPATRPDGVVNVGVAAHIAAASPGGPRFVATQSQDERSSIDNGIWLCETCAKKVDADTRRYTVDVLKGWRSVAEEAARSLVGRPASQEATGVLFAAVGMAVSECRWTDMKYRPEDRGCGRAHQLRELGHETDSRVIDPVLDVTILQRAPFPTVVSRVGFQAVKVWTKLKGYPSARKIRLLEAYRLPVAAFEPGETYMLALPDPVHVDAGASFRFRLWLDGFCASVHGNESVIRLLLQTPEGRVDSPDVSLGMY